MGLVTEASGPALQAVGLSKAYSVGHLRPRRVPAVSDLSLEVQRGEVFGYLGPNGSGKTTTLKLLLGLIRPDAGSGSILGFPLDHPGWRFRTGYLPENPYLYDYLTPLEYLDYVGRLFGMKAAARRQRSAELLQRLGLEPAANMPLRRFSKGMLQRAGLAQALLNDPELVFLDEPMSGLDPVGRRLVRNLIQELRQRGCTVFFSTHILPDAEALCDRVALLRGGRLVRVGRMDEIASVSGSRLEVLATGVPVEAWAGLPGPAEARRTVGERACR